MPKARQWFFSAGLLILVVAAALGLLFTSNSALEPSAKNAITGASGQSLVDQRPLETARAVAALPATSDEQRFAAEVLRLADHEVDLAFADALRDAAQHPTTPSPEARDLQARVVKATDVLKTHQAAIDRLSKQLSTAKEQDRDSLQQQIDVSKAELELDQDELDDAKADLARAGGDSRDRIQRLMEQHESTQHQGDSTRAEASTGSDRASGPNLLAEVRALFILRDKQQRLKSAQQDALAAAADLSRTHDALESRLRAAKSDYSSQNNSQNTPTQTAAAVSSLRRLSNDQKNLSDLDKRIQDNQELAENYAGWSGLVRKYELGSLHSIIQSAMWILLIALLVYLAGNLVDRFFSDPTSQRRRLVTLRAVLRFSLQALGVMFVLFVLFGMPSQMPTILGLAGAGLTVALKDFIVAFFGWFVLMGRNGIRVGDWVEINGVGGEVVEIGLLRTVLLETGNWTDSGHPTGRKVAFVNSFAIEGHFFNFSTTGQWLWDELQVLIPATQDPYPVLDAIRSLIARETAENARTAEDEWQHAAGPNRVRSFSARPAINLRPTSAGIEVHVRYIARAHERYALRTRLYQAVVDMLHHKPADHAKFSVAARADGP
ncbi:MAG TPA: mechanosensitive ion channel domain-containing protein [Terriglobales bacterium]|nr:mechanosensitive ion channel domain-containing protein [Terriglobales bacterium]